jgi:DNA-directed RNA polymerase subunit RPC12/RpoP
MDPMDYFLWDEFVNPGKRYQCRNCGTLFTDEEVSWSEEDQSRVAVCPECGTKGLVVE